ncbi:hypothetical protein M407DRAFT_25975 [Tulasnella calospora MUT 4182]|uniref:Uncharacterized protein n=1 Tax=Tulasnella calospora MUT 4182 TaxID=1051891 RepID=A0A0C3QF28_9AGAM|nr:hypothetical protein M407DRAFT_25975 [Tulasnella calospora MUT 4182]
MGNSSDAEENFDNRRFWSSPKQGNFYGNRRENRLKVFAETQARPLVHLIQIHDVGREYRGLSLSQTTGHK